MVELRLYQLLYEANIMHHQMLCCRKVHQTESQIKKKKIYATGMLSRVKRSGNLITLN